MTPQETIRAYYRCFKDRDRETLEDILTPDFVHISPFGRYDNRDRMLDAIWPSVGKTHAVDIEIFGHGPAFMVRYGHNTDEKPRLAEYVRFKGDKIAEIEVYLGCGAVPGM